MTQPSILALTSDTDSDSEPNTTNANVFWGNLKTPEKSRINNDPPQTIIRSRSTVEAQSSESRTKLTHEIPQDLIPLNDGKTWTPQTAGSVVQGRDHNSELATTASSAAPTVENANDLSVKELSTHPIQSPEIGHENDNNNLTDVRPNTPVTSPSASNTHPVLLELPTTPHVILPVKPSPDPFSRPSAVIQVLDKTPVKQANDPSHHLDSLSTPQVSDSSARRERRIKLKHNEDRGRFPLLSLSPASTNVLNLVQSPLRNVENKLTIPQSPLQKKAQRVLVPTLSQSPVKSLGLLRLPSPVKLDDPNRIPARRVPILHSPVQAVQNDSFFCSPARRIPIIGGNKSMVNRPDTPKQTADNPTSTSFAPSHPLFRHPPNIASINRSTRLFPGAESSQRNLDPTRSDAAAKAGPSRLPVLSARSIPIQPPSNSLVVRKRLDPAPSATTPSQIPSPAKPKTGNNALTFVSQTRDSSPELKRKRAETESEDETSERPHKRTTAARSTVQQAEGSSRIEISQAATGSTIRGALKITHDPLRLTSDIMETNEPSAQTEPTSEIIKAKPSVIPTSHPRRTSRVRRTTTGSLKARGGSLTQANAQPLSSRTDSPSKLHAKPPSRPPSRAANRSVCDLNTYPDNPRQLQWLTSLNTQHNQESIVELEHQVIRKFGNRPPSPSSKFRIDAKTGREEREARAERRQRRDRNNDSLVSEEAVVSTHDVTPSNMTNQQRHMRAPGDDEDYETPVKASKLSQTHPNGVNKMVKWSRGLVTTSGSNSSEQQTQPKVKLKSCFLREPTTLALNFLGNVPHADEPLPGLVKEHIVISRFVYDDDIQEESPRRSKKKLV